MTYSIWHFFGLTDWEGFGLGCNLILIRGSQSGQSEKKRKWPSHREELLHKCLDGVTWSEVGLQDWRNWRQRALELISHLAGSVGVRMDAWDARDAWDAWMNAWKLDPTTKTGMCYLITSCRLALLNKSCSTRKLTLIDGRKNPEHFRESGGENNPQVISQMMMMLVDDERNQLMVALRRLSVDERRR